MTAFLRRAHLFLGLIIVLAAPPAVAQGLDDFFGRWEGGTVAADDPRAAFVEITGTSHGGFDIFWRNYSVNVADSGDVSVVERDQDLQFLPTSQGNWIAAGLDEGVNAVAQLDGSSLEIVISAVTEDGLLERQIYRREIVDNKLALGYTRVVGGEIMRTLTAMYVRSR